MPKDRVEAALSILLTAAALVIAAAVARREFGDRPSSGRARVQLEPPRYHPEWQSTLALGIQVGDTSARAKLVEFFDLECPACRRYNQEVLRDIRREFGRDLSVTFVHLPLPFHRFARLSARASECAAEQGRFEAFVDTIYALQDSLGLKSWGAFAADAAVPDTARFVRCVRATAPVPRVDSGLALAARLEVSATPTLMINGWRFQQPPVAAVLRDAINDILKGKEPDFQGEPAVRASRSSRD